MILDVVDFTNIRLAYSIHRDQISLGINGMRITECQRPSLNAFAKGLPYASNPLANVNYYK